MTATAKIIYLATSTDYDTTAPAVFQGAGEPLRLTICASAQIRIAVSVPFPAFVCHRVMMSLSPKWAVGKDEEFRTGFSAKGAKGL
jgi:hypothetical protein